MANYDVFKSKMLESYDHGITEAFIRDQFHRLHDGQRGIAICDAALVAWEAATKEDPDVNSIDVRKRTARTERGEYECDASV